MNVRSNEWHRNVAAAQLVAYLMIITIAVLGFARFQQTQEDICRQAQANRQATRNLVVAIDALGQQLVLGSDEKPTPEQLATLKVFKEFRDQQLTLLEGPVCP